jgi:hypothetical protein
MSCCGQKRMQLKQEMRNNNFIAEEFIWHSEIERKSIIFEYTGQQRLQLKGISTGNIYYFRQGEKVEVNYFDSFSMMAERELKISK